MSIDNVLVFDDGLGSLTLSPAGLSRNYSAARAYQINTTTMTATETFTFTAANAGQNLFSPICGSAYDVGGNYLVDFTTANANAAAAVQSNATPGAVVGILTVANATTSNVVVGVGGAGAIQFVMATPSTGPCDTGWNSLPFSSNVFTF